MPRCGQGVSIFGKALGAGMDLTQVAHYQGGAVGVWRRFRFDAWTVSSGHVTTSLQIKDCLSLCSQSESGTS